MSPQPRRLTGGEIQLLWQILLDAYDRNSLQRLLRFKLDKDLGDITAPGAFSDVVFQLLDVAEMEGWTFRLLLAVREDRPQREELLAFVQEAGVAPLNTPPQPGLEKLIVDTNAALDIMAWRTRLGQIEGQVCRVEIKGQAKGTGFLVGPDLLLTNWHVVNKLKDQPQAFGPSDVVLRFDYKRMADGVELNKGKEYRLVTTGDDWLVDHSPWSPVDLESDPKSRLPCTDDTDELDFALLRIAGSPGNDPLGENIMPGSPARGFVAIPPAAHAFAVDTPLFIVQHPAGAPLKLQLDTKAVIGLNGNGTRVRYKTNTEGGSSGSPVFDQNWNLVALHHSGDPDSILPTFNEGIPIRLIADRPNVQGALG